MMINIKALLGWTFYMSRLDQFLKAFDKKHRKLSASQLAEKQKYARVYALRDNPNADDSQKVTVWDKF